MKNLEKYSLFNPSLADKGVKKKKDFDPIKAYSELRAKEKGKMSPVQTPLTRATASSSVFMNEQYEIMSSYQTKKKANKKMNFPLSYSSTLENFHKIKESFKANEIGKLKGAVNTRGLQLLEKDYGILPRTLESRQLQNSKSRISQSQGATSRTSSKMEKYRKSIEQFHLIEEERESRENKGPLPISLKYRLAYDPLYVFSRDLSRIERYQGYNSNWKHKY